MRYYQHDLNELFFHLFENEMNSSKINIRGYKDLDKILEIKRWNVNINVLNIYARACVYMYIKISILYKNDVLYRISKKYYIILLIYNHYKL